MIDIQWADDVTIVVDSVDNQLNMYINPDTGGPSAQVYGRTNHLMATVDMNEVVNMTGVLNQFKGEVVLSAIGSNFAGGGDIQFQIFTDSNKKPVEEVNASLGVYESKQWAFRFIKQ